MLLFRAVLPAAIVIGFVGASVSSLAGVVRGEVRDAEGKPGEEVTVALQPVEGSGVRVAVSTNRVGAFLFGAVPPGSYEVRVESRGLVVEEVRATTRSVGAASPESTKEDRPTVDRPVVIEVTDRVAIELQVIVGAGVVLGTGNTVSVEAVLAEAVRAIQGGRCADAEKSLAELVAAAPDVPKAHYLLGYCMGFEGRGDAALAALDRALELRPGFPGAAMLKGQILAGSGRHDLAEAAFRAEIASALSAETLRDAWWGLGLSLRDSGNTEGALEAFSKATETGSGRPEAWVEIAELRRKSGDLDRAASALERAADAGVDVARARLNLGVARLSAKQFREAARIFEVATSSAGASARDIALAYGLLGKARLAEGDRVRAREALRKSIETDPEGELAGEARELLKDLGG